MRTNVDVGAEAPGEAVEQRIIRIRWRMANGEEGHGCWFPESSRRLLESTVRASLADSRKHGDHLRREWIEGGFGVPEAGLDE